MEVPEVAVVVVAERRPVGHDQAAVAADLVALGEAVAVPPQHAVVLLVDADGVAHHRHRAVAEDHRRVEVADLAQAVAAQLERVGGPAHAHLALVEDVAPEVLRLGVAVGHDHLGHGRPVEHRSPSRPGALPSRRGVVVGDLVEHESLDGVHRQAHAPALPAQLVALQLEARPLRLVDVQRAEVAADGTDAGCLGIEAAGIVGDGDVAVVDELHDLVAGPVPDGDEALHGPGPRLVERAAPHVEHGAAEAPALMVVGPVEPARRPRLDVDLGAVGHAPPCQRGHDVGMPAGCLGFEELLEHEARRAGPRAWSARSTAPVVEVGHHLVAGAVVAVDDDRIRPPIDRPAGEDGLFVRLGQGDPGELRAPAHLPVGQDQLGGAGQLLGGERARGDAARSWPQATCPASTSRAAGFRYTAARVVDLRCGDDHVSRRRCHDRPHRGNVRDRCSPST